nr:tumor necrosis factor ligand superfamily member 12 [Anolis sagrei ordinatus]
MGRQRRSRDPPARLVLLALALASGSALLLASLSLLLAAWPRSGARLLQQEAPAAPIPQELLSEDEAEDLAPVAVSTGWNSQGKFLHHLAQQGALRQRRQAGKGKRSRPRRPSAVSAAHYEVQSTEGRAGIQADANGTIHGWAEAKLNTTSPLRYDRGRREFTVVKRGLYYLYCQVHFNEGKTIYMKLDVMLDGELALRCLEQFPPTSSGPQEPELKVCQVSGLVLLTPGESIRLRTIPKVRLKAERYLTYFGLFQVHSCKLAGLHAGRAKLVLVMGFLNFLRNPPPAFHASLGTKQDKEPYLSAMLSPTTLSPGLMDKFRTAQGSAQPPSFLNALWVVGCALGMGLLAGLFSLVSIQWQLDVLRGEIAQLRGELAAARTSEQKASPLQQSGFISFLPGKQSVLHLIPGHHSSNDEENETEIWWEPFLQKGRALELSGRDVVVKQKGLYFVYSQVLFHDPTFTMGQVLWRMAVGRPDQILFRCVQSMPAHPGKAYNSCYSGGIFHLQHGDRLNLRIPRFNASFDVSAHGTFLGLLRL